MNTTILELIKNNKFFRGLNDSQLQEIVVLAQEKKFKKNDYIIKEGDLPDVFYLIKEGEIEITKKDPDKEIFYHLGKLKAGAIVGEVSLVTEKKRTASISALTDVVAISFLIKTFRDERYSDIALLLMRNMSEDLVNRLDDSNNLVVGTMQTELKKSRKIRFYQFIIIFIMTFFLIELGMTLHYIWSNSGLCKEMNETAS